MLIEDRTKKNGNGTFKAAVFTATDVVDALVFTLENDPRVRGEKVVFCVEEIIATLQKSVSKTQLGNSSYIVTTGRV